MNKTKNLIFKSAIKIFSESGYRGATMDDIAANAGLVKGHYTIILRVKRKYLISLLRRDCKYYKIKLLKFRI